MSADQCRFIYEQVRKFREPKPIFTLDFWNDGEYSEGCLAGGRFYLHINAGGDYEPCAFIHYSDTNVRTHTLLAALQAPLFTAYKEGHQNPVLCWIIPMRWWRRWSGPALIPPISSSRRMCGSWPQNVRKGQRHGRRWPMKKRQGIILCWCCVIKTLA